MFQDVLTVLQFFITLNVCQHLDGKHAIFGRVCSGMGTVKRIGNVQTGASLLHLMIYAEMCVYLSYACVLCRCK